MTPKAASFADVQFRLGPASDAVVDVHLRSSRGRWLAVADTGGRREIGLGRTAREALVASLTSLGPRAAAELLTDLRMLDVSRQLRPPPVG